MIKSDIEIVRDLLRRMLYITAPGGPSTDKAVLDIGRSIVEKTVEFIEDVWKPRPFEQTNEIRKE